MHLMPKWIAFLRAINVGGHTVRMEELRDLFSSLGLSDVETYIASGNVVFESNAKNARLLEITIEKTLRQAFGYEVATFIRTASELSYIANWVAFPQSQLDAAAAFNIAFLAEPLDRESKKKVLGLKTAFDDFAVRGREIYWLCRRKQSDSTISNVVLEKALSRQLTIRGINTIRKMAVKYSSPNP
jgi:uncharacterized protein (DUF1697 family)